jgi:hypothetical protein
MRIFRLSLRLNEIWALLGFYGVYIGSLLPTFRDNLSDPSSSGQAVQEDCLTARRSQISRQSILFYFILLIYGA